MHWQMYSRKRSQTEKDQRKIKKKEKKTKTQFVNINLVSHHNSYFFFLFPVWKGAPLTFCNLQLYGQVIDQDIHSLVDSHPRSHMNVSSKHRFLHNLLETPLARRTFSSDDGRDTESQTFGGPTRRAKSAVDAFCCRPEA